MSNSFHLIPSVTTLLMLALALSGCGAPEPALPSPPASAQPAEDAESSSPEPSTGAAFGCLPPTGQEEALPGFLFDITDDPYDGTTMLRMTNNGENDFSLSIGDVGLAALSAGPRAAASDLSQASSLDGTTLAIRAGETILQTVQVDPELVACGATHDRDPVAPIMAVAINGEALPYPILGAAWRG